jgi:hypothetical protein
LKKSIKPFLKGREKEIVNTIPVLCHLPRLDVIAKFLSQGKSKIAQYDFDKKISGQPTVNNIFIH